MKESKSTIPDFKTYKEEAEFWDTHSPLDFPGEFEEVHDVIIVPSMKDIPPGSRSRKRFLTKLAELPEEDRLAIALHMAGLTQREINRVVKPAPTKPRVRQAIQLSATRSRKSKAKAKA